MWGCNQKQEIQSRLDAGLYSQLLYYIRARPLKLQTLKYKKLKILINDNGGGKRINGIIINIILKIAFNKSSKSVLKRTVTSQCTITKFRVLKCTWKLNRVR